jgi:hypothetical protein
LKLKREIVKTTYLGSDGQADDSQKEDDRKKLHFLSGDCEVCESNAEWERLLYPRRQFSYRFKRGEKGGTLETGATSRNLSCHVDINVANSNRNCQPNRAHHQVCIEHLCSNLCWPGLNPHDSHCPLSLHRVESKRSGVPIHVINFALVLKSFVANGCRCFNEDQPDRSRGQSSRRFFWLEIRFVYDLKKKTKQKQGQMTHASAVFRSDN